MALHPEPDRLRAAAAGDVEARREVAEHVVRCEGCRASVAHDLGVLAAAAELLGPERTACPEPELLAELPPGSERDHPHVASCPLCREEIDLIRALEARAALGEAWSDGPPVRGERLVRRESSYVQGMAGAELALDVVPGEARRGRMVGVEVGLAVTATVVVVTLDEPPAEPLELVLENDLLERRIALAPPGVEVPRASWRRAAVRPRGKPRP